MTETKADACQTVTVARVNSYESIAELAADSQLVVTARVLPGTKQVAAGEVKNAPALSADLVPVEVSAVLSGSAPKQLTLRVMTSSCPGSNLPAPLEEGVTYVLFLKAFETSPDVRTGEWVMTTDASIYKSAPGDVGFTLLTKESGDSLPAVLDDVSDLKRRLEVSAAE